MKSGKITRYTRRAVVRFSVEDSGGIPFAVSKDGKVVHRGYGASPSWAKHTAADYDAMAESILWSALRRLALTDDDVRYDAAWNDYGSPVVYRTLAARKRDPRFGATHPNPSRRPKRKAAPMRYSNPSEPLSPTQRALLAQACRPGGVMKGETDEARTPTAERLEELGLVTLRREAVRIEGDSMRRGRWVSGWYATATPRGRDVNARRHR